MTSSPAPRLIDARAAKDYATADEIRAALVADGWIVETTANGTVVRDDSERRGGASGRGGGGAGGGSR